MPIYKTLHTLYGLQRMAAAAAAGVPIALTEIAVGDGNGNPTLPDAAQTQLVRERFRAAVNRVYQDPALLTRFTAELVIPASAGGFTLREVGVFDADGSLFVVGNLPETYKPTDADGAYSDTVIRVEFRVDNADVIVLQIDPNIIVATQTWIINNINAATLIPGGTTAQVLAKHSNADGDTAWVDPSTVNVTVNTVEEKQTLAADQTVVDLARVNTRGLAVYVDGWRLGVDDWIPDETLNTRFALVASYPDGTELIAVQNEPTGNAPAPLERSRNLADVADAATSRANLDVYSRAESDQKAPPSEIAWFARATAPAGWLKCNGAAVSRTAYAALFAAIGTAFGAGDGFNTFNLPDLRGEFVRGLDDGRGIDAGRVLGSWQADELKSHTHDYIGIGSYGTINRGGEYATATAATAATGGAETRPRNVALLVCIKF